MASFAARVSTALTFALVLGCTAQPEHLIDGLVHGCAEIQNTTCKIDGPLTVWLPGHALFEWRGARVESKNSVEGGVRYVLEVQSKQKQIEARLSRDSRLQVFRLQVAPHKPTPALEQARQAINSRQFGKARSMLSAMAPRHSAAVASLRARLLQREGKLEAAALAFEKAAELNRAHGREKASSDAVIVAAYLYIELLDQPESARRVLRFVGSKSYPAARVRKSFFLARSATFGGDMRMALHSLQTAHSLGERIGLDGQAVYIKLGIAQALQHLGRTREALEQLEQALNLPSAKNPCARSLLLINVGWIRYLAAESERRVDPKVLTALRAALQLLTSSCDHPDHRFVVRINLVLACLAAEDNVCAQAQRQALHGAPIAPQFQPWLKDADGRIALAKKEPGKALSLYTALVEATDTELTPELVWRAHVGRAEALLALKRLSDARAALEAAEAQLDAELNGVPLQEGRESFVADRGRSARMLVDVLLQLDQPQAAFNAARRARARVLGALRTAARLTDADPAVRNTRETALAAYRKTRTELMADVAKDAERSAAALATAQAARRTRSAAARTQLDAAFADIRGRWQPTPRDPQRLTVLYHPTPRGWVGFAAQGNTVVARRLPDWRPKAAPTALSAALIQPFAAELQAAKHVEFMPFGAVRDLDLHALLLHGQPLAAIVPVSYALDVPSTPEHTARTTAIIIADPRGDLPAARTEADAVAKILASSLKVEQLRGLAASPSALRAAAERADVLHYAGHGVFKGVHGWESVLPLADGQSVGVGDILALRQVPRLVVLSGCETGRSAQGAAEGLGLGQAFVAAGSQAVIAAVRPVPDEAARILITTLHTVRSKGASSAEALRQAQTQLRAAQPQSDWAAFRLLHP